jgi:hypothetical protein
LENAAKEDFDKKLVLAKISDIARSRQGSFKEYWGVIDQIEKIGNELGSDEMKRIAMDAIISKDLETMMCTGSNAIGLKKNMDIFYDVKGAEWFGVQPSSMNDII